MTTNRNPRYALRNLISDGILYSHWLDIPTDGWSDRWPNFEPWEFASRDKGEFYYHPQTFDAIQRARDLRRAALVLNSAHRSWLHNLAIRGAPRSAHLYIALDVSTWGHNRLELYEILLKAGFTSFGFYVNFIHVDLRPGRRWFGSSAARSLWLPLLERSSDASRLGFS